MNTHLVIRVSALFCLDPKLYFQDQHLLKFCLFLPPIAISLLPNGLILILSFISISNFGVFVSRLSIYN